MKKSQLKKKICLITFPIGSAGCIPLKNISKIILELSENFSVITGAEGYDSIKENKNIKAFKVTHSIYDSYFFRILSYICTQIKITIQLLKIISSIDLVLFFIGGDTLIIPILISKLFRKKVILIFPGSTIETLNSKDDNLASYASILSKINCMLCNRIVIYSNSLITKWGLQKFIPKISIASEHIINLKKFNNFKPIEQRENIIGFIGRLSPEKGITNFLKAAHQVLCDFPDTNFLIIGDGPLKKDIDNYVYENNLKEKIFIKGWLTHNELVHYLNEIKILIIPSYTEGLPNIMLEAMACGTPVIANSVGSIPDIIINNKNGFLLNDNDPSSISDSIMILKDDPNLLNVSIDSRKTVMDNYNYEKVVRIWKVILNQN